MKKAGAYIRKSTKEDNRQVESFEGQRREIERFAEVNGFQVVKWYKEAYSGTEVKHRKVFLQMLEDARSGKFGFQYVICYDISRFGRLDNDEAGYYRHELRKSGVEVVYAAENLQGDDTDDLIISTKQWLAREYSRKIGEYVTRNTLSRVAEARDAGRAFCIGRASPYGYDTMYVDARGEPHAVVRQMPDRSKEVYDPDGDLVRRIPRGTKYQKASTDLTMLVPSAPERVETVRRIFAWYVEKNLGQLQTVNRLNEALNADRGPASPTGVHWTVGTIQSILTNEHYIGNTVFNKRTFGKFFRIREGEMSKAPRSRRTVIERNRRKDWIVIEGTHEPIIDPDLFRRAQRRRRQRREDSSRRGRSNTSRYLFSGKLRCVLCGHTFHGKTYSKNGNTKAGYVCSGYKAHGTAVCQQHFLPEHLLEEAVVGALSREFGRLNVSGAVELAAKKLAETPAADEAKRAAVRAELTKVEADIDRLLQCITPENREIISEKMVALQEQKKRLVADLEGELGKTRTSPRPGGGSETVKRLMELARDFSQLWQKATFTERREFLLSMVDHVAISPERKSARLCLSANMRRLRGIETGSEEPVFPSGNRGGRI